MDERLKELRKELRLTQQAFADRLGVKRNTVATYETGKSNPQRCSRSSYMSRISCKRRVASDRKRGNVRGRNSR